MPDIRMIKYHSLPMAAARALVQKAADDLAAEYDLTSKWVGSALHFRRSGVEGVMRVSESEIDLEVTLGFLLKAFKAKFVEHIEHNFDTLLEKAHSDHHRSRSAEAKEGKEAREGRATAAKKKSAAKVAKKAGRKA